MFPLFEIRFDQITKEDQASILKALMNALITVNLVWLREHKAPAIYDAAPEYLIKPRPFAIDSWQDIPTTLAKKSGDCKDFVAWRCAELMAEGIYVCPLVQWDGVLFHFLVSYGTGRVEDPSDILGMDKALAKAFR